MRSFSFKKEKSNHNISAEEPQMFLLSVEEEQLI